MFLMLIFVAFLANPAQLSTVHVFKSDASSYRTFNYSVETPHLGERLHEQQLTAGTIQSLSRLWFQSTTIRSPLETIVRTTPVIDGHLVEGADGVSVQGAQEQLFFFTHFLLPESSFKISPARALEVALFFQPYSLIHDPYIERIGGTYEPVWLFQMGEIRPAFKTRLPTLIETDLLDIYVDGETEEILKIEPSAYALNAPADGFIYSPKRNAPLNLSVHSIDLPNIMDVIENRPLNGQFLDVRNCCPYYTCPENGPCTDENKTCAYKSHSGAIPSREVAEIPTATMGLNHLISLPPTVFIDTIRCTNIPLAKASKSQTNQRVGYYYTPIDDNTKAAERDEFSEVQAYFSIMSFFNHIRFLLNDPTWCLRKEAMLCDDAGNPLLNSDGKPTKPYKIFVNQMIPDTKMDADANNPSSFINQIKNGKGSKDNPVVINELARSSNAAFVPALSTLKTKPRADELMSGLIREYDHNTFFQGDKDFAYDGDVVFHEFMHAVTASLINKLNTLGLDSFGINSEPGSINEGWADYFSAAFSEDPLVGEYAANIEGDGETSLRNIQNQLSCPSDVIGEIHNDSQVWSGALWEIRSLIKNQQGQDKAYDFDRAVLATLAMAKNTESFNDQADKLISNLESQGKFSQEIIDEAKGILKKRGVKDCFRAFNLSYADQENRVERHTKKMMFVPSRNNIGIKNFAPANSELEIGIPAGTKSFTISFRQFMGGTGAMVGDEVLPNLNDKLEPLAAIVQFDNPIAWHFENRLAVPKSQNDERIEFSVDDSRHHFHFENGTWNITIPVDAERCEQKTAYMSVLSQDYQYILKHISVSFDKTDENLAGCDFKGSQRGLLTIADEDLSGCQNKSFSWLTFLSLISLLATRYRRRRR